MKLNFYEIKYNIFIERMFWKVIINILFINNGGVFLIIFEIINQLCLKSIVYCIRYRREIYKCYEENKKNINLRI